MTSWASEREAVRDASRRSLSAFYAGSVIRRVEEAEAAVLAGNKEGARGALRLARGMVRRQLAGGFVSRVGEPLDGLWRAMGLGAADGEVDAGESDRREVREDAEENEEMTKLEG